MCNSPKREYKCWTWEFELVTNYFVCFSLFNMKKYHTSKIETVGEGGQKKRKEKKRKKRSKKRHHVHL